MQYTWKGARDSFWELLDNIEQVRKMLHCNISSAWFRGHDNSAWQLHSSVFRINGEKIDLDREKQVSIFSYEKKKLQIKIKKLEEEQKRIRSANSIAYRLSQGSIKEVSELTSLKIEIAILKEKLTELTLKINITRTIVAGEQEAFVNWSRRSENSNRNSWEILAEMQHYKVGTRLLDWTENLSIGLYFAIERYIDALIEIWNNDDFKKHLELPFILPENLSPPCIWILNPYELARYSAKDTKIIDPTISDKTDYFKAFFLNKTWPYKSPIPIYPPWRNPRIMAQQGMFTVQGWDARPLEEQLTNSKDIIAKIDIPPEAAVYAAKHLLSFQGIDKYFIYRDLDNLGGSVKDKFLYKKRN